MMFDPPGDRRLLVFGGAYSNLHALRAMKARADELGIDPMHTICTGDVVAYCAEPNETVIAIREWGCQVIAGNCEEQLAAGADDCGCGFAAGTACERAAKDWFGYANQRISIANRTWMAALPGRLEFSYFGHRVRVLHGGADQINRFVFASEQGVIADELARSGADLVIAGHAGLPFIRRVDDRVWFNPGVIGMPANDGTPDGWYGLLDCVEGDVVLSTHRLRYEHTAAAAAMARAGHANDYAIALSTGLWPSLDALPATERAATGLAIAEQKCAVNSINLERCSASTNAKGPAG